jgi:ATP-dependent helicase HrpA
MENRLRQRGFVADDLILYRFYDQRLGDVCSRNELNTILKQQGGDDFLKMSAEDVSRKTPEPQVLADFPQTLPVGEFTCRLSYKFQPGAEDDGVTADLVPEMLPHVSPSVFEWLVPGLLPAKVEFLLKGLPKGIRKQLIPIKQTAKEIAGELSPYKGSLYRSLAKAIFNTYRVRIMNKDWPEVPDHLKIRFRVIDSKGKAIRTDRDLHRLLTTDPQLGSRQAHDEKIPEQVKTKWEKDDIIEWDFEGLPDKIPQFNNKNQLYGYAYPGLLQDEQGRIGLRLFNSPIESAEATRHGLGLLYAKFFPKPFKALKKECATLFSGRSSDWALYEGLGGRDRIRKEIFSFVISEVFDCRMGTIPNRQTFQAKIDAVQAIGLYSLGSELLDLVLTALQARRSTIDHIDKYAKISLSKSAQDTKRFQDYREQLDQIIAADFLTKYDKKRLAQIDRYCQGLRIRVERAHAATRKDAAKAAELAPHIERMNKLRLENLTSDCQQLLNDYCLMLEEFKISLFAQELKTAFPVSANVSAKNGAKSKTVVIKPTHNKSGASAILQQIEIDSKY